MGVEFKDNSASVKAAMQAAKEKALTAMGQEAVEVTTNYMQTRYGKPIRQTGDLMRDVNYRNSQKEDAIDIGNSLEYAPWVHNGTAKMTARPYLRDAISENADIWKGVAAEHLGKEMK